MISGKYSFLRQDEIIFGRPSADVISEIASRDDHRRVLVVSGRTLSRKTDVVSRIEKSLGARYAGTFDECREHVPRASVMDLANLVRTLKPDLIVTVGGGTPIDTVKVMLAALAEDVGGVGDLDRLRIRVGEDGQRITPEIGVPPVRQVVVPTTLSGAEFSEIGGATDLDRQVKDMYCGREIGAKIVILDPEITIHTPRDLWASTGVRAVDHAIETICSRNPQPFTDGTSLYGLSMMSKALLASIRDPNDLNARLDCQLAVWLCTTGLGRIDWGASHGIGHQLGAVAGVMHGHCSCVMLPSVLRWNATVNMDRQRMVAEAMGSKTDDAAAAVEELVRALGQPSTLRDVGVRRDQFDAIASGAMQNMMVRSNPRPIENPAQVREILEMAW